MIVGEFRSMLRALSSGAMAALLTELAFQLYSRDIVRWRVLTELADELMDRETFLAKRHLNEAWLKSTRKKFTRRARRHR